MVSGRQSFARLRRRQELLFVLSGVKMFMQYLVSSLIAIIVAVFRQDNALALFDSLGFSEFYLIIYLRVEILIRLFRA